MGKTIFVAVCVQLVVLVVLGMVMLRFTPDVVGIDVESAHRLADSHGVALLVASGTGKIEAQAPRPGTWVLKGASLVVRATVAETPEAPPPVVAPPPAAVPPRVAEAPEPAADPEEQKSKRVPSVLNRPLDRASAILSRNGLHVGAVRRAFSADHMFDRVIAQDPPPGGRIRSDRSVDVTINAEVP